jgi:hypothetical protein
LIVFSIGTGLFSTSPRNQTSPRRPPSAIATACFFLATSKAKKASLYFPTFAAGANPLSWRLAGLVAIADWIGSNQDFLP